jgi:outer membrane protein assembly factor BamB
MQPALLCRALTLVVAFGSCLRAEDWPQFLGPTRDAVYHGNDLASEWPKEGPPILWHSPIGQGFSGPVVAEGKTILFHRIDKNEIVQCFDAESGKALWDFSYPSPFRDGIRVDDGPRATPAISEGKVYTFGADGALHCLDLKTGAKVWNIDTRKKFGTSKNWHGMICSPLVEGNSILLNIGSTNSAGLVAFNKQTGDILWQKTKHRYSCSSPVAATIGEKRYAFFFTRRTLCAVNPADGHLYFEYTVSTPNKDLVLCASPVVFGDLVFVSAAYQLGGHLLRVRDGKHEVVWTSPEIATQYTTSIHHDGCLYGVHGQRETSFDFRCVDLKTGKLQWKRDDFGPGTMLKIGDEILFLTYTGQLFRGVPSPKEFKVTGRAQVASFGCRAYPALADGRLYVRGQNRLFCLDLRKK